jgi:membrane protein
VKKIIEIGKRLLQQVEKKHLPLVAAGLAYYFLMSLFPALILLTAIVASLPLQERAHDITLFLAHVIPPQGISVMQDLLTIVAPHRYGMVSFGLISMLWLASKGAKGVISGVDIMYEVQVPRSLWVNRILAVVITFVVGILLVLAILMILWGPKLQTLLATVVPAQSGWLKAEPYLQWCLAALFTFSGIEFIYLLGPNLPAAQRLTVPGALLAAAMWMALSWGLGFYFRYFGEWKLELFYGVLATPIAFMVWLYWSAAAILIGAQVNLSLMKYKMSRSTIAPSATVEQLRQEQSPRKAN